MLSRRDLLTCGAGLAAAGAVPWFGAPTAEATTVVIGGYVITGAIYDLWSPNRTVVGTPTTNEYPIAGGTKQKFTKALMYTSPEGASIIRGMIRRTFGLAGGTAALGIPVGVEVKASAYATYSQACTAGRIWWSSADGGKAVPTAKTVRLRGARNFRDAAGTGSGIAVAGGRMRRGVLYRSNKLQYLSAMDASIVTDLGVTQIIDLRQPAKIAAAPDRVIAGIAQRTIDVFGAAGAGSDARAMYRSFANDAGRRGRIAEAVRAVAAADAPMLLHCTYGKDRTGWIVAMIQYALGASDATVLDQWLKSNSYLGTTTLYASYLGAGLTEARRLFGSIEGYLADGLGLSAATRAQLRERLVA